MDKKDKTFLVRLSEDDFDNLEYLAEDRHCSKSAAIRMAIEETYVRNYIDSQNIKKILTGINELKNSINSISEDCDKSVDKNICESLKIIENVINRPATTEDILKIIKTYTSNRIKYLKQNN